MLDLVREEHVSLLVRPQRPHSPAVPVPERLLKFKYFYCLGNKYTYRKREIKATVNYKRKLSDQKRRIIGAMQLQTCCERQDIRRESVKERQRESESKRGPF